MVESGHPVNYVNSTLTDASTLTDVCGSDDIAEVEIFSLISEQIPKYKLRADTITDFTGYENSDWVRYPAFDCKDADLELSEDQIENTLSYFTLCGVRVSQMSKTYNDIDAVTTLLEEKERDLEIAARIGQSLLDKNRVLQQKNDQLEEDVQTAVDKVSQLRHELGLKDALLHIYTNDDNTPDSPDYLYGVGLHNVDGLRRRLSLLEEENIILKTESSQIQSATDDLEEKESRLVDDCVRRLSQANDQVKTLSEENARKTETYYRQQEEITNLLAKLVTLECRTKKVNVENAELQSHVHASQLSQKQLTAEICQLNDKYEECLSLLHESNEEMKRLRNRQHPRASRQFRYSLYPPHDSLASELESSLNDGLDDAKQQHNEANSRVLETARLAKRVYSRRAGPRNLPGSNFGSECGESPHRNSLYISDTESTDASYLGDVDSVCTSPLGRAGLPGSNDLETALRRLSARHQQERFESRFHHHNGDIETMSLGGDSTGNDSTGGLQSREAESNPTCWTPDSYMSIGSGLSAGGGPAGGFKFPQKLQIVKPLEGSATLHQWQCLARPDLASVLDDRPGVMIKGERKLDRDCDMESYTLSDFEEDDDYEVAPRRFAESTSMTYTMTTCTVLHPTDDYSITSSYPASCPSIMDLNASSQVSMATNSMATMATGTIPTMATGNMPYMATGTMPTMATGTMPTMATGSMPTMATGTMPTMATGTMLTMATGSMPSMAIGTMPTMATGTMSYMATGSMPTMATGTIPTMATGTMLTNMATGCRMTPSASFSSMPSAASTPLKPRGGSTSTFSFSLGLAHTLRERGFLVADQFDRNRVSSVVTETIYDNQARKISSPTIYTQSSDVTTCTVNSANTTSSISNSSIITSIPSFSINAPDEWIKGMNRLEPLREDKVAEFALNLTEKIQSIGLDSLFESRGARPKNLDLSNPHQPTKTPPNSPSRRKAAPTKTPPNSPTPGRRKAPPMKAPTISPSTPPNSPTANSASLSSPFSFRFSSSMSQLSGAADPQKGLMGLSAGPQMGLMSKGSSISRVSRKLQTKNS